jgi:outer membrane protein OmpA-like peptidoglycan-associated protein
MFDDEEEDNGFFLLVLGVLAAILLVVTVVSRSGDDLPAATVTGDAVEEEAATTTEPETTTTEAPETTTTTTEPPATTETAESVTMWDALVDSGEAVQFVTIGGALGLQADLEALTDADGNPVERTLFAPSDEALAKLSPAELGAIAGDPDLANAVVGYHFLDGVVTAEDLLGLDGEIVPTRTGLPMSISVVDGEVFLNETIKVTSTDFGADNGVVHIIDTILTPPTINEVIGLENIEFEVSSAVITPAGEEELQKVVAFFAENEAVNGLIEAHTDTDGSEEGNLALSQSRAESVLAFLVENGIAEERLTAVGFGESQPILVDGVEDKVASRRIEFEAR